MRTGEVVVLVGPSRTWSGGGEGSGKREEACTCTMRAMLYKSLENLMTMIYCESVIVMG
jgi:hypothetical protein